MSALQSAIMILRPNALCLRNLNRSASLNHGSRKRNASMEPLKNIPGNLFQILSDNGSELQRGFNANYNSEILTLLYLSALSRD